MTRRVVSGLFLTLFTMIVAVVALMVLLFSQLPDLGGLETHPGHYLQRHLGRD